MKKPIGLTKKSYIINGKKYSNISEIPENHRKTFEDKNNNGIPDITEDKDRKHIITSIKINSKKYNSWDEVPQEYQKYKIFREKSSLKQDYLTDDGDKSTALHTNVKNLTKIKILIDIILFITIIVFLVYYFLGKI